MVLKVAKIGILAGRQIPLLSHANGRVRAGVLPVHRTQSGAGRNGATTGRLPLVQLQGQCTRCIQRADQAARAVHAYRPHLGGEARREGYGALFKAHLDPQIVDEIRRSTNGGFALGNERFKNEIEQALGRRVTPGAPRRPPRTRGACRS